MIRFHCVTVKNFMSYGNIDTIFNLTSPGTTLILGQNGVGKTTIMNSLVYAIYNRTISKVNVDELVNRINKKNMEVTVEFERDGHQYKIERVRKGRRVNGKDTWVKLYIDGEDKTPANVEEKIEEVMGMPHDMFVRVVVISALHAPFLELKSAEQTSFIENLFNLTAFSEMAKILNTLMKSTNESITINQIRIDHTEKSKTRHVEQVTNARSRFVSWDQNNKKAINDLENSLASLSKIDFEKETKLHERLKIIKNDIERITYQEEQVKRAVERVVTWEKNHKQNTENVETSLKAIASIDFDKETNLHNILKEINTKITEIIGRQTTLADLIKEYKKKKEKYENDLKTLHKKICPYCLQEYKDVKDKVVENEGQLQEAQKMLDGFVGDLTKVEQELPNFKSEKKEIEDSLQIKDVNRLQEMKNQSQILAQKLQDLKNVNNPHIEAMDAANNTLTEILNGAKDLSKLKDEKVQIERDTKIQTLEKLLEAKNQNQNYSQNLIQLSRGINPHTAALEELEALVVENIDYTEINALKKRLDHQTFLYKLLTKRDSFIRKAFINRNLPYLNKRLKQYLEFLELPFKVEFTSELTANISQFGTEVSFSSLSNGQQARVNLGLALSFRDVQATLHPPVNICLLDEVFDLGLDDEGIDLATKILKQKAKEEKINMFIISHRGLSKTLFDNAFRVVLEKDFAVIQSE